MNVEKLLTKLNEICDMYELDCLAYVYEQLFDKNSDLTPSEMKKQILIFEHEGKTGYDCGWSRIEFFDKDLQAQLDDIIKKDERLSDFNNISVEINYTLDKNCIQVTLPTYPLYVQSTTIKNCVQKFMMEVLTLTTEFKQLDYVVDSTLD